MIKPENVPTRIFIAAAEEAEAVGFSAYAQQLGALSLQSQAFESEAIESAVKTIFNREIVAIDTFEKFAESIGFTNSKQVWGALLKYARPSPLIQEFSQFETSIYDYKRRERLLKLKAEHGLPNEYGRILPPPLDLGQCFVDFDSRSGTEPFLDVDRFRATLQSYENPDEALSAIPNINEKSTEFINLFTVK